MKNLSGKQYTVVLFAVSLALAAVLVSVNYYTGFKGSFFGFAVIQRYQYEKLNREQGTELIMLGDSSLGCAISPGYMEELTGKKTLKLALNGMYGLAGPYNLLCKAVETQEPEIVLLMVTPGMLLEPTSWEGYVYSSEGFIQSLQREPKFAGNVLKTWIDVLLSTRRLPQSFSFIVSHKRWNPPWGDDYALAQITEGSLDEPSGLTLGSLSLGNDYFLDQIRRLCDRKHIRLVFAFSPFPRELMEKYEFRFDDQKHLLRGKGIPFIGPYPAKREQLADTIYHIRPNEMHEVTAWYAAQLKAVLSREGLE